MKRGFRFPATAVGTISLLLVLVAPVRADGIDQYQVRRMVEQGEILPLEQLLERHRPQLRGRIIDLELEYEHGRLVYEIELVNDQGRVRDYLIDARSGEWLGEEK